MSQLFKSFDASEKTQLICFPFAGGYSASFRPLHAFLQGECEMLTLSRRDTARIKRQPLRISKS